MKRPMPWSVEEYGSSSSDESSSSNSDSETDKTNPRKSQAKSGKQKSGALDFEALKQHGYKGGLSVLGVPPPKERPNWSWSTGREGRETRELEESYEERQKTRDTIVEAEQLVNVETQKDKMKQSSFSQKEKRKRELGQASRGKNYVEEEKRLLRDSGVYSGFDT